MNFFKEINRLQRKYNDSPEVDTLNEALSVFTDYLQQLENQIKQRQYSNALNKN